MTRSEMSGWRQLTLTCPCCAQTFQKPLSEVRKRVLKQGQTKVFCSQQCARRSKAEQVNRWKICQGCGGEKSRHAAYCQTCAEKARAVENVEIECRICEKPFSRSKAEVEKALRRGHTNFYCSRECYDKAPKPKREDREQRPACLYCGAPAPFGQKYCSFEHYQADRKQGTEDSSYRREWLKAKTYVMERDKRTCAMCSATPARLDVHHIDEDATNNTPQNLIVLCTICHRQYHRMKESMRRPLQKVLSEMASS